MPERTKLERAISTWRTFCAGILVGGALFGWYCNHIGLVDRGKFTLIFVFGYPLFFLLAMFPSLLVEIHKGIKKYRSART